MPLPTAQTRLNNVKKNLVTLNYITQDWLNHLEKGFEMFASTIMPQLSTTDFYPEGANIFKAFKECSYENLKVVLIGQDPYHDGSATGLCFSNKIGTKMSPSLRNIFLELKDDIGNTELMQNDFTREGPFRDAYLGHLPYEGVLMLNTALTVEPHKAGSHTELWKPFMGEVFKVLNEKDNIVWIMLGNHAKSFKSVITNPTHKFVEAVHPSPLSASRGFFGSKIFSRTNEALTKLGLSTINW